MNKNSYKIYIKEYDLSNINKKILDKIDIYFKYKKEVTELISNEGIFSINNNKIYKKNITDIPIEINTDFIIDKSYFEQTEIISQIPFEHLLIKKHIFYYSLTHATNLRKRDDQKKGKPCSDNLNFIIEGVYTPNNVVDLNDKYLNFVITDFYFLANVNIDLKKEINVFLSILN